MSGYRNCRWCRGAGCISCEVESAKDYKKAFPDGPKPIAVITFKEGQSAEEVLGKLLGAEAIAAADLEAGRRAAELIQRYPGVPGLVGATKEEAVSALRRSLLPEVLDENIRKAGDAEEVIEL